MDRYTKFVLTIIAISLSVIAVKIWEPREARAGVFGGSPTLGDLLSVKDIKDSKNRQKAYKELMSRIPLVWIQGGRVGADVN